MNRVKVIRAAAPRATQTLQVPRAGDEGLTGQEEGEGRRLICDPLDTKPGPSGLSSDTKTPAKAKQRWEWPALQSLTAAVARSQHARRLVGDTEGPLRGAAGQSAGAQASYTSAPLTAIQEAKTKHLCSWSCGLRSLSRRLKEHGEQEEGASSSPSRPSRPGAPWLQGPRTRQLGPQVCLS